MKECGYEFTIGHNMQILYGTLCVLSADNPASSACGGFKESCSARKPCRLCLTNLSELSTKFTESQVQLRNPSDHFNHLLEVEGGSGSSASVKYGINHIR